MTTAGTDSLSLGTDTSGFFPFAVSLAQIDATVIGPAQSIGTIHLRRSAVADPNPAYAAQTVMITARMAHADFSAITGASQSLQSLLTTPWTTVIQPRAQSLPDLTNPPTTPPAPWNVPIALDAPFAYNGTDALIYEIFLYRASMTLPVPFDAVNEAYATSSGSAFGTGCQSTAGPFESFAQFQVYGTQDTNIVLWTSPAMPTFGLGGINTLVVGFGQANTPTGLCTALTNTHDVVVPLPSFSIGGSNPANFPTGTLTVPHDPAWIGTEIFVQGWSIETNNPGVLIGSQSYRSGPYPAPPANPIQVASTSFAWGGSPTPHFATDGGS